MTVQKWTDERTAQLTSLAGVETPVSVDTVKAIAVTLVCSDRSVASKLRKMGYEVASMAKSTAPTFTAAEAESLSEFVKANSGNMTYTQIAEAFADGSFTSKQVQGKILSMELTAHVKPTEKLEAVRTYSEAEEATFVSMCASGSFVEDIATALNKTINSVRGKALSLLRSGDIDKMPAQKESHAKAEADVIDTLGDLSALTVAQIAEKSGKTERGIKTLLTRRGLTASDYDGKAKREKNAAKAAG
jgi:hypothetical protein